MGRYTLIASIVANMLLALAAWWLFKSNADLNIRTGAANSTIEGFRQVEVDLRGRVSECNTEKVNLVTTHNTQISSIKSMSDARVKEASLVIEALRSQRGILDRELKLIKSPEVYQDAQKRIEEIDRLINEYVKESRS
jgi:hypothetical protein